MPATTETLKGLLLSNAFLFLLAVAALVVGALALSQENFTQLKRPTLVGPPYNQNKKVLNAGVKGARYSNPTPVGVPSGGGERARFITGPRL